MTEDPVVYTTETKKKEPSKRKVVEDVKPEPVPPIVKPRVKKKGVSRRGDGRASEVRVLVPKLSDLPIHPTIITILEFWDCDPRYVDVIAYNEIVVRNQQVQNSQKIHGS